METSSIDALWQLVFMFIFVALIGYMAPPLPAYISYRIARSKRARISFCVGAAYWGALFVPWFYLLARITGERIPRRVTIAFYVALYMLWRAMDSAIVQHGISQLYDDSCDCFRRMAYILPARGRKTRGQRRSVGARSRLAGGVAVRVLRLLDSDVPRDVVHILRHHPPMTASEAYTPPR